MPGRLLITGAGGFVAGAAVRLAARLWETHAVARKTVPSRPEGAVWHDLDLCDSARLRELFLNVKPSAVLHAAAVADIDFCQANREIAESVNVGVARELARLCAETGARMVFCSTDTVFDGEKGMCREEDAPGPVNFYAETKVRAERVVLDELNGAAAVPRLSLVMGLPLLGAGNSFLSRMLPSLESGREVGVPGNEIRTPIDVVTLARALLELAGNDFQGVLHLAGNDRLNRFDMTRRIAVRMGFPAELVVEKNPEGIPGRAPRPRDVSLDNRKARELLKTPMLGLENGLERVLEFRKGRSS